MKGLFAWHIPAYEVNIALQTNLSDILSNMKTDGRLVLHSYMENTLDER